MQEQKKPAKYIVQVMALICAVTFITALGAFTFSFARADKSSRPTPATTATAKPAKFATAADGTIEISNETALPFVQVVRGIQEQQALLNGQWQMQISAAYYKLCAEAGISNPDGHMPEITKEGKLQLKPKPTEPAQEKKQ